MLESPQIAAIRYEPDGYNTTGPRLMGRQAAGLGFLRAAIAGRGESEVVGYGPDHRSADAFVAQVTALDPQAQVRWIPAQNLDALSNLGVCYVPHPDLTVDARLRLRVGVAKYSLCGITHTTASAGAMESLMALLREPVMPWDALICTSSSVAKTVREVHDAEAAYLRWKFGPDAAIAGPQLPVIPLGVHCADFNFTERDQAEARTSLGINPEDVVALYVGRLVFHGKAHPLAMLQGLEVAAQRTGAPVVALLCGWAPTTAIEDVFRRAAAEAAPSVRFILVDGRDDMLRRQAWASGDLFVSLADGIQETFGLTPIEAKAARLPIVCTDWNGYRDTVLDGVDGFRVSTWSPGPGAGNLLATWYEAGAMDYDRFCWAAAITTSVNNSELAQRLTQLVGNPHLRKTMGQAGRVDAENRFDWAKIYGTYQSLWADLNARRVTALKNFDELIKISSAPSAASSRLDPFLSFKNYPSHLIISTTRATCTPGFDYQQLIERINSDLFVGSISSPDELIAVWKKLAVESCTIFDLTKSLHSNEARIIRTTGVLAKMGAILLQ